MKDTSSPVAIELYNEYNFSFIGNTVIHSNITFFGQWHLYSSNPSETRIINNTFIGTVGSTGWATPYYVVNSEELSGWTLVGNKVYGGRYVAYANSGDVYYNNYFINQSNDYFDGTASGMILNTSVNGVPQGNYWDNISTMNITDKNGDGFGDNGSDYPYAVAGSYDWGPIMFEPGYTRFSLDFIVGWNMFSLPLNVSNWTISNVLANISGNYGKVLRYNSTSKVYETYSPSYEPWMNNFTDFDDKHAYWISITQNCSVNISGNIPIGTQNISVFSGWNLIPWYSLDSRSSFDATISIYGSYGKLLQFNTTTQNYETYNPLYPPWLNNFSVMKPGYGYWIAMVNDNYWTHST